MRVSHYWQYHLSHRTMRGEGVLWHLGSAKMDLSSFVDMASPSPRPGSPSMLDGTFRFVFSQISAHETNAADSPWQRPVEPLAEGASHDQLLVVLREPR